MTDAAAVAGYCSPFLSSSLFNGFDLHLNLPLNNMHDMHGVKLHQPYPTDPLKAMIFLIKTMEVM